MLGSFLQIDIIKKSVPWQNNPNEIQTYVLWLEHTWPKFIIYIHIYILEGDTLNIQITI